MDILLNVILIDLYLAGETLLFLFAHNFCFVSISLILKSFLFSDSFFGFVFQTRFLIWESFFIFGNRFSKTFLFFDIVFPAQISESFFQIVFLPEISKSFFGIVFLPILDITPKLDFQL